MSVEVIKSPDGGALPQYDCLVLSGGGAKAAYGAGVAKALWEYRALKHINTTLCLVGTSAGALNAAVLATAEADNLISFWESATNRQVLGVWANYPLLRGATVTLLHKLRTRREPYSLFPNKGLRQLLRRCINYTGDSHIRPLIVTATDYTAARLAGFYSSQLVGRLKDYDLSLPAEERRLQHLQGVTDVDHFFDALLASAAIPLVFPPVAIGGSLYIDGGIGNNTPTREAAYFLRRLAAAELGAIGEVFCVTQDTARTLIGPLAATVGPIDIADRVWNVYHTVHTRPIVDLWRKINNDVVRQEQKVNDVSCTISGMHLSANVLSDIKQLIDRNLRPKQQNLSITFIEPSSPLGDTLNFDPTSIRMNIDRGYTDFVKTMYDAARLSEAERTTLNGRPIFH